MSFYSAASTAYVPTLTLFILREETSFEVSGSIIVALERYVERASISSTASVNVTVSTFVSRNA